MDRSDDLVSGQIALLSELELQAFWQAAHDAVLEGDRSELPAQTNWFRLLRDAAEREYTRRAGDAVPDDSLSLSLLNAARALDNATLVRLLLGYQDGFYQHRDLPANHPLTILFGHLFSLLDLEERRREQAADTPAPDRNGPGAGTHKETRQC
jgi:hypothetical protein